MSPVPSPPSVFVAPVSPIPVAVAEDILAATNGPLITAAQLAAAQTAAAQAQAAALAQATAAARASAAAAAAAAEQERMQALAKAQAAAAAAAAAKAKVRGFCTGVGGGDQAWFGGGCVG